MHTEKIYHGRDSSPNFCRASGDKRGGVEGGRKGVRMQSAAINSRRLSRSINRLIPAIRSPSGTSISFSFFSALGSRKATRVARTRRLACPNEAVSPRSHQSPSMRGFSPSPPLEWEGWMGKGWNPRNVHTGALTRYYRGIIQTYLYPSPMTADMTCDRLRYRLHDMFPSPLSLFPSPPLSLSLSLSAVTILHRPLYPPSCLAAIVDGKYAACTTCDSLAFICSS